MANYYATARSNYFRVKDRAAFNEAITTLPDLSVVDDAEGRVALLCDQGDGGGWPSGHFDDNDEYVEADVPAIVAEHLAADEVAVFMEAGAEKLRYVSGSAIAINGAGERREVALRDIYDLAAELGANVSEAQY
jgi:hypothetical protein